MTGAAGLRCAGDNSPSQFTASIAAHADWSVDPRKRWVAVARRCGGQWRLAPPCPVGDVATFLRRLREEAAGGPVALGVDLPLGVPRAYAAQRPEPDFLHFLRHLRTVPDFFRVCADLAELRPERPFYPFRGVAGMTRAAHAAALRLGSADGLCRACDRATAERPAGAPLFWTLGANQSGKAAIAAWRDMLLPALAASQPIKLWPFAGPFCSLLAPRVVALAETYPAEALRHLGIRLNGSKRRQSDRAAVAAGLRDAMLRLDVTADPYLQIAVTDGFGRDAAGEDRFDCVLGVLCVLNVLAARRPDTAPDDPWIRHWEGWVLGQTALPTFPLPPPADALAREGTIYPAAIPAPPAWPLPASPPQITNKADGLAAKAYASKPAALPPKRTLSRPGRLLRHQDRPRLP